MTKLKFLVSLLLALGLVACNGDEDETDDAKYSLKVAKPSGAKVGTAFPVEVKLYKGDALVKGDDAKGAKDADVSGSIKCKEHTAKVDLTKVKLGDAGKASFSVTIEENSNKDDGDDKGYTECVVSASTKFGEDKTEASGASDKFDIAKKDATDDTGADDNPSVNIDDTGKVSLTNGEGELVKLVKKTGSTASQNCVAKLIKWDGNTVSLQPTDGFAGNDDKLWVSGNGNHCELHLGDPTDDGAKKDISSFTGYTTLSGQPAAGKITLTDSASTPLTNADLESLTVHESATSSDAPNGVTIPTTGFVIAGNGIAIAGLDNDQVVWVKHKKGVNHFVISGL